MTDPDKDTIKDRAKAAAMAAAKQGGKKLAAGAVKGGKAAAAGAVKGGKAVAAAQEERRNKNRAHAHMCPWARKTGDRKCNCQP
jgi:hypothetical protein